MSCVVVNDASCLIDLRKGRLLHVLLKLPYRFVVPLPVRESELLEFTDQEWQLLDDGGMEIFDLPPERMTEVARLRRQHPKLTTNDCSCLVSTQCYDKGILLTGDGLLRRVAADSNVRVHGVLWVIDELKKASACEDDLLIAALEAWHEDQSVFLPATEIDKRLRSLSKPPGH